MTLTATTTDGANNPFNDSSILWFVIPEDKATIRGGKTGTLVAREKGTYTVLFSGRSQLPEPFGRQFAIVEVNILDKQEVFWGAVKMEGSRTIPQNLFDYEKQIEYPSTCTWSDTLLGTLTVRIDAQQKGEAHFEFTRTLDHLVINRHPALAPDSFIGCTSGTFDCTDTATSDLCFPVDLPVTVYDTIIYGNTDWDVDSTFHIDLTRQSEDLLTGNIQLIHHRHGSTGSSVGLISLTRQ